MRRAVVAADGRISLPSAAIRVATRTVIRPWAVIAEVTEVTGNEWPRLTSWPPL